MLEKVSTSHSPLLLWFPLKALHLRSTVWKALRMSAAPICVRFTAYQGRFGFYNHPVWDAFSRFWLHKTLRFRKTNNSLGVTHQIRDRQGRVSNLSLQMSGSKFITWHVILQMAVFELLMFNYKMKSLSVCPKLYAIRKIYVLHVLHKSLLQRYIKAINYSYYKAILSTKIFKLLMFAIKT